MIINRALLEKIIDNFNEVDGSDIHFSPKNYIGFRVKGGLQKRKEEDGFEQFTKENTNEMYELLKTFLTNEVKTYIEEKFKKDMHTGFSFTIEDGVKETSRFRVNVAANNGGYYIVLRIITAVPPKLEDLNFYERSMNGLKFVCDRHAGMFLVVGSTGSGKSTTLAGMIRYINEKYDKNIITLEDPIEYEHDSMKSQIVQKELGRDFTRFLEGLHSALREDPDVILIGEIRDETSLNLALKAAETGHLVFATLHTNDAVATIQRLTAMSENPTLTRDRLSQTMLGAIAQKLIVGNGGKRMAVWELLVCDKAVATQIKEGKDIQIKGMLDVTDMSQSYNKTIKMHYERGKIDEKTAIAVSPNAKELDLADVKINSNIDGSGKDRLNINNNEGSFQEEHKKMKI